MFRLKKDSFSFFNCVSFGTKSFTSGSGKWDKRKGVQISQDGEIPRQKEVSKKASARSGKAEGRYKKTKGEN